MTERFEPVLTIEVFHDVPRSGVTRIAGQPYRFSCRWSDLLDDYDSIYRLTEIAESSVSLEAEKWEIFLRWRDAFLAGRADRSSFPALPPDRDRLKDIDQSLQVEKARESKSPVSLAQAEFRSTDGDGAPGGRGYEVRWRTVGSEPERQASDRPWSGG